MNAKPHLLDTNVLLHLIRGRELGKYIDVTFRLSDAVHRPLVSIVTHGEIWVLADRNSWSVDKRAALQTMLDNLVTVDLNDQTILDSYVELSRASQSVQRGARALGDNDLWIAATAKAADAVLLTTDQDFLHFHPVHCLVQYVDPASRLASGQGGTQESIQ